MLSLPHKQYYPQKGWVEHDPEELIDNINRCAQACPSPAAIGIDNQGESCLAWNRDTGEAITNVIVWQDNRTRDIIDTLQQDNVEEMVLKRAGLPLDSYFSATKLGWIIANIPEAKALYNRGKLCLGTTDAFFLHRLTGCFVTDISTASRTSLYNLHTRSWDSELCRLFGVPLDALPEIVSTTGNFGTMEVHGRDVPVTASVVDQQAALYGHGCIQTGDSKITFGTGAFALAITGKTPLKSAKQGLLPTVAWQLKDQQPIYALDGGVFSAASAVNWAKSIGLFSHYSEINNPENNKTSAIERGLVFIPALSGLGSPHWDRSAGGLWLGLSLDTTPADLMKSILEGIAFRAAEVIAAMDSLVHISQTISIDGGLSTNPYFCQFLADVLKRRVRVQTSAELTALGTAQLAAENSLQLFSEKTYTVYRPERDRKSEFNTFQDGLARSKNWHHPAR